GPEPNTIAILSSSRFMVNSHTPLVNSSLVWHLMCRDRLLDPIALCSVVSHVLFVECCGGARLTIPFQLCHKCMEKGRDNMNITQVRHFLRLAETGSFVKTAELLD